MKKVIIFALFISMFTPKIFAGESNNLLYIPKHRIMAKYDPVMECAGMKYEYQMKFRFRPSVEFLYGNMSYLLVRGNWYAWKWLSIYAGIGVFQGSARGYNAEFYPSLSVGVNISLPISRFMFEIEAGTWGQFYPMSGIGFGLEF